MSETQRVLPDISRFGTIAPAKWLEFGNRLRDIGLTDQYVARIRSGTFRSHEAEPILTWHLRRRREPAAYAYRMLSLRDPVSETEAAEALGSTIATDLCNVGLLFRPERGQVVSAFDLQLIKGLFILCDDLANSDNVVFGAGPGTRALCRAIPQRPAAGDALDLGCGAGTVALWAARYARRVLATDINPRALVFVEINAAINGISNVETRMSDLFEGVSGRSFHLITAQLPFVPDLGIATSARWRFGGPRGNELALRAISEMPPHLAADGRSLSVFLQPINSALDDPRREIERRSAEDMRTLLLLGPETDADAFSVRYAATELRRGMDEFDRAAVQMREHLSSCGIHALSPAICILQQAPPPGWVQTVQFADDLWRDVSASAIERLLASLELLRQPAGALLRARLRIVKGALTLESFHQDGEEKIYLAGPAGSLVRPLEITHSDWALLQSVHRAPNVGSALTSHEVEARAAALLTISRALRAGVFNVQAESAG